MGRKPEEAKGGAPAWIVTMSDLNQLLLTFFILLFSFANTDLIKYKEAVGSLKNAFGVQTKEMGEFPAQSSNPISLEVSAPKPFTIIEKETLTGAKSKIETEATENERNITGEMRASSDLELELKNYIMDEGLEGELGLSVEEGKVTLRAVSKIMFTAGSAKIIDFELLTKIAFLLKTKKNFNVTIEGHTDDVISGGDGYPSNWELSAIRATSVLRFLVQSGVSENRLRAVSYGSTKPYVPNTNSQNRDKNRRVEFVFSQGVWD